MCCLEAHPRRAQIPGFDGRTSLCVRWTCCRARPWVCGRDLGPPEHAAYGRGAARRPRPATTPASAGRKAPKEHPTPALQSPALPVLRQKTARGETVSTGVCFCMPPAVRNRGVTIEGAPITRCVAPSSLLTTPHVGCRSTRCSRARTAGRRRSLAPTTTCGWRRRWRRRRAGARRGEGRGGRQ